MTNIRLLLRTAMAVCMSLGACAAGQDAAPAKPAAGAPGAAQTQAMADVPDGYRIGAGDVLQISVYKEPEASVPAVVVRTDGRISLPLIKEIEVAGLSPLEAEKAITEKLGRFIHSPDVTVIVSQVHSQKVYLVGAVRSVRPLELRSRLTVLQAITEAGGPNDYAKRRKIYVLRNQGGKQTLLPFDYDAVIRGDKMEQNILLQPNDTIVVPQ